MKVLAITFAAGLAFLALMALALGAPTTIELGRTAQAFPFHSLQEDMVAAGWKVVGTEAGGCSGGATFVQIIVVNDPETIGWYIFYSTNEKIAAGRYAVAPDGTSTLNLISYGKVVGQDIVILSEVPFDREKHVGPCDWFNEAEA